MHRVQSRAFTGRPLTVIVAGWRLGMKRRRVRTLEWLTLLPDIGPLPHASHRCAMGLSKTSGWDRTGSVATPRSRTRIAHPGEDATGSALRTGGAAGRRG